MRSLSNLKGAITALVTPFAADGSIDYVSLRNLIEFQINDGIDGLLICGTTGETPSLSPEEYRSVISFSIETINHRVPVIVGTGTNNTATTIANSQLAEQLGADGLLVVTPYYNKPTPRGIYEHFNAVCNSVDLPVIVYNVPGRTGANIPAGLLLKMAEDFENVFAVKEASGKINQIMEILHSRPEGFKVYSGDDSIAYAVTAMGGDGCISVVSNQIPGDFSKMLHAVMEGNTHTGLAIHNRYFNLMNLNFIETNPAPVKTSLHLMGLIQEAFRLPMVPMGTDNKITLQKELRTLNLLQRNGNTKRESRAFL